MNFAPIYTDIAKEATMRTDAPEREIVARPHPRDLWTKARDTGYEARTFDNDLRTPVLRTPYLHDA